MPTRRTADVDFDSAAGSRQDADMRFLLSMHAGLDLPRVGDDGVDQEEIFERMNRFEAELREADALLALEGLRPPTHSARVSWAADGSTTVTDGPFAEAKEAFAGYWIIDVASKDEAVGWARRIPAGPGVTIHVDEIWELSDLPG
jgi:hypothetical protein